ncbi:MAG: hypothetical protein COU29_01045 [Candidatus Magasanikbacteria bacterium CG10_big_fil_rev_8_21_14_0_10_36_32]|uniref:Uncharacterized protein n=1 Tax=Candidatus Magasanikbacteria bacterium CG10_big_fil_rev_8_21_14_0_10_36_32 TaxID=1974646 RepID=A0A2M6W6D7_9BACT|nr:MAG: hypothetical protein COU29_01045 [Candidatus Magasanikbacteria bacterium CG10_big_fil_rev_8_21_14_0_10_36_32]
MINFYEQQNRNHNYQPIEEKNEIVNSHKINGKKPNFEKYDDPTGEFDSKQLKWGMWYVQNKILLRRIGIGALFVFIAITFGFSLWKGGFILYYDFFQQPAAEIDLTRATNYNVLNQSRIPQQMQIMDIQILPGGVDKNDVIAELVNPNERYIVYFDYYFDFGGQQSPRQKGFLLPFEVRPIAAMGLDSGWAVGLANLMVENISWQRISNHLISDVKRWQDERLIFSISDFVFKQTGVAGGASSNIISFKLTNESSFSYKDAVFYVGLYQNGSLVGLMKLPVQDFHSLEVRDVDLRSFVSNLVVSEIKLFPAIDLYDKAVYLQP